MRTEGIRYRFVATATPSPNDYIELLAYAAYLDIMDVAAAKTRFFRRNSEKADQLTLHPHKEEEFWLWVASWALFVQKLCDLGFDDHGYQLPYLDVHWHELPSDHTRAGTEKDGQGRLFSNAAVGVVDAAREKRESLPARIAKLQEIRALSPSGHRIIWHDLEAERHAIEAAVPDVVSVYGAQDLDEREQAIVDFSDGKFAELAAKPVIAGAGCNFQRHCHQAVILGIGFKFRDFIQAVHRIQRFGQRRRVRAHWAPEFDLGDWSTAMIADAYGGDEAEEINARTGCTGCPLASEDKALDTILSNPYWAYLAPLKGIRVLWRELREPRHRLCKAGFEYLKDGSAAANPQRIGPLTFEARLMGLERILDIQAEVNASADRLGRPRIDLINPEEEARIRELIAAGTWPQGRDGDEPTAAPPMDQINADGSVQPLLFI